MRRPLAAALCLMLAAPAAARPLAAGSEGARQRFERQRRELAAAELAAAADYFQELSEWALALRAQTVAFARELEAEDSGRPLGGGRLDALRLGTREHLAVRDEMLAVVALYRGWIADPSAGSGLPEELRVKGVMLSLAGALVLYDNFAVSVALFQGDGSLRRILNRSDRGFGLEADSLLDKSRWRSVDKLIPGYFTHVGIWLGGERELRALGIWDDPLVAPHHPELRRGEAMLEAVRAGVRLVSVRPAGVLRGAVPGVHRPPVADRERPRAGDHQPRQRRRDGARRRAVPAGAAVPRRPRGGRRPRPRLPRAAGGGAVSRQRPARREPC